MTRFGDQFVDVDGPVHVVRVVDVEPPAFVEVGGEGD
jgi:hypothetical protein